MFNNFIREDKLELTGVNSRIDNIEEEQLSLSDNIGNLQAQIDGEVSSYFMEGTPRNNYRPSSEWTDDTLKQRHLGDTYTNILPYEIDLTALDKDNKLFWFEKGGFQGEVGDYYENMFVDSDNHYRTKCLITTDNLEGGSLDFFMVNSISDSVSSDFNVSIYYFNNNNQCVSTVSGFRNGTEYGFELLIDTTYHYAIIVFEVSDITDIRLQRYNNNKYINPDAGKSYRWCNYDDEDNNTWHWHPIADSDAIRALQKVDELSKSFQTTIDTAIGNLSENFQTEIDNIEIGGRNLLTGTQTGKGFTFYINRNLTGSTGNFNKETHCFELKCAKNTNSVVTDGILLYSPKLFLTPGKYTLSFDYKYDGILNRMQTLCVAYNESDIMDVENTINLDTDIQGELNLNWNKYKYTFIIKEEFRNIPYWKIRIDYDHRVNHPEDQILYIKDLQLEIGNKATDWMPAHEDIQNGYTWDPEKNSFAIGKKLNNATGNYAFAEGESTTAQGDYSHAGGYGCTASHENTFVFGQGLVTGTADQAVIGKFNKPLSDWGDGVRFIIGSGNSDDERRNLVVVQDGECTGDESASGGLMTWGPVKSGVSNIGDFGEYFEWADGNPNNEDRIGYMVQLNGDKIELATAFTRCIGVISATASFLAGACALDWQGRFLKDKFGRYLKDENSEFIVNPDYNPNLEYTPREQRKEWDVVGLVGQVITRQDGSLTVGGHAGVKNGIATNATTGYRVLKIIDNETALLLVK